MDWNRLASFAARILTTNFKIEMALTSRDTRKYLQKRVESGDFPTRQSLIDYGMKRGWIITGNSLGRIKFSSEAFLGNRKSFSVKVSYEDEGELNKSREIDRLRRSIEQPYSQSRYFLNEPYSRLDAQLRFIYILVANSEEKSSAYIGHSSTITKRLHGHLKRKIRPSSSGKLRTWANSENVPIRFCVVEGVYGDMTKAEATSLATNLEGLWTHRARRAGVSLPGVEGWGQFPKQANSPDDQELWDEAARFAVDTESIFAEKMDFQEICMPNVPLTDIRIRFEGSIKSEAETELLRLSQ
ncbi:MAG: hypothetical protein AAGJ51_01265 [Pseudomonadota bacterium]